jgi:hypothetical protein
LKLFNDNYGGSMTKLQKIKMGSLEKAKLTLKILKQNGGKGAIRQTFDPNKGNQNKIWWIVIEKLGNYRNVYELLSDVCKAEEVIAYKKKLEEDFKNNEGNKKYPKTGAGYLVFITKYLDDVKKFLKFLSDNGGEGKYFEVDWPSPKGGKETRYRIAVSSLGKFNSVDELKKEFKIYKLISKTGNQQ